MAVSDTLRPATRVLAVAVYLVIGHALVVSWLRVSPALSTALEAVLCGLAAWGLTRATDGRWRGAALVGLLVELLRLGLVAGLGDGVRFAGSMVVVPSSAAAAAWLAGRRRA